VHSAGDDHGRTIVLAPEYMCCDSTLMPRERLRNGNADNGVPDILVFIQNLDSSHNNLAYFNDEKRQY
jgi:hypothetical protein